MEMDDELTSRWRQWADLEGSGREAEADEAFGEVWRAAAPEVPAPPAFTGRAMQAIAAEAVRQAEGTARLRRAGAAAAAMVLAAAAWFGAGYAAGAVRTMFLALFNLSIGAVVKTAAGVQAGTDLWSLLGSMGHAASAFVADPRVTFVLLVLQGLALAALVALQRLLGSDGESWK